MIDMKTALTRNMIQSFLISLIMGLFLVPPVLSEERIKLATTTSTDNSGLLEVLLPPFEAKYNIRVDVIAVGTGKALRLGENGDVDIVLVHAREAEEQFIEKGYGVNRRDLMYNDFVFVGSEDDPAGITGNDAITALKKIAATKQPFVSRGDESGTHAKEKKLWAAAEINPEGVWYVETGQGMGATLQMADEKQAYCLTDRGTFIALEKKLDLVILCEGDERLLNPYGIIAVNPHRHPHVNYVQAMSLIGWFTSPEGQRIIGEFKKNDQVLFYPNATTE
jgi:tungstate transport system substrate-binding protein